MKRKIIILFLLHLLFLLPFSRAYMQSNQIVPATVQPPLEGRGNIGPFIPFLTPPEAPVNKWFSDGQNYLKQKEYEQAILAFRKAKNLNPTSSDIRFFLAFAYEKRLLQGLPGGYTNWEELATNEYLAAIDLGDHLPARYNLAMLYKRNGELEKARKELEHILLSSSSPAFVKIASAQLSSIFSQDMYPKHLSVYYEDISKQ